MDKVNAHDIFKFVIGFIIVIGFLTTLGTLFFIEIPEVNKMAVDIVLGSLGTMTVTIISYLYGSSRGSKEKDIELSKLKNDLENK